MQNSGWRRKSQSIGVGGGLGDQLTPENAVTCQSCTSWQAQGQSDWGLQLLYKEMGFPNFTDPSSPGQINMSYNAQNPMLNKHWEV